MKTYLSLAAALLLVVGLAGCKDLAEGAKGATQDAINAAIEEGQATARQEVRDTITEGADAAKTGAKDAVAGEEEPKTEEEKEKENE